jgi:aldehyde dehydrogenase (NAD+)
MNLHKEEFVDWLVKESGSTRIKAKLDFQFGYEWLRHSVSYPSRVESKIVPCMIQGKESRLYRKPLGVIGTISPWNYPVMLTGRAVAPAIALGNAVVLKPATQTPVCGGLLFAKIFEEAGLPRGVFNVIVGDAKDIKDTFVVHPIPKLISFTGSTEMGRHIAELCGNNLKRFTLELGGNNACLVLEDADIENAVECSLTGKFLHSGQICICINRFIVHKDVYDKFTSRFVERVRDIKVGDPAEEDTLIGPLINKNQLTKIEAWVKSSIDDGAKLLYRGEVKSKSGNFLAPIVLGNVTNDMAVAKNEMFGPVASFIKANDEKEMIRIANQSEYGLAGSIHSQNLERAVSLGKQLQVGMVHINDCPIYDETTGAFGGEKFSGIGRYGNDFIIEEYTTVEWITLQLQKRKQLLQAGYEQMRITE